MKLAGCEDMAYRFLSYICASRISKAVIKMKNRMMGGMAAVCLALSLTACSDDDVLYGVAPTMNGRLSLSRTEDIRPGEALTASIPLPTGGENIYEATYTWNNFYEGEERDGVSYYAFHAPEEPGTYTLAFGARYIFSSPTISGDIYNTQGIELDYTVVSCDIFSSKWADSAERTCEIYPGLEVSADSAGTYVGHFPDVLQTNTTDEVERSYVFTGDRLTEVREVLDFSAASAVSYGRKLALMRRLALRELGMTSVREYYVPVDDPDTPVSFDADAADDSWMADLGAKAIAGTHRIYCELRSAGTRLVISMAQRGEGFNEVRFERVYSPMQ